MDGSVPVSLLRGDSEHSESASGWAGGEVGGRLVVDFSTYVSLNVEAADSLGLG